MIERYSERERDLSKQRAGGEIIRKVAKVEKITIVRGSRPSDMRQLNKIEFPAYTNCTNTNPPTNTRSSRISFFRYQTISKYFLPEKYPSKQQKHSNGMTLCYLYSPFIIGSPCKIKTQVEDADIFLSLLHKALILKKKKNASFFLDQFEFLLIYNKTRFFFQLGIAFLSLLAVWDFFGGVVTNGFLIFVLVYYYVCLTFMNASLPVFSPVPSRIIE